MGDQGFDPCECVSPHELAMRRLLCLLRQSQSYCTDTECYETGSSQPDVTGQSFMFTCMMMVFALFLFFYQTPLGRSNAFEPTKSRRNENNDNGTPPSPPPSH